MPASNSKNVRIYMTRSGATGVSMAATGASKADPAVITVADSTGILEGDIISFGSDSTGLPELDGKTLIVGEVIDGTTFEVLGVDTTNSTGNFAAGSDFTVYSQADIFLACLSVLTFNPATPDTVSAGTFCDPSASVPNQVTAAGTVDIGGYIDVDDADYQQMLMLDDTGETVYVKIELPGNGYIVFSGIISGLNYDIPLDGALAWNATLTLSSKPRHVF